MASILLVITTWSTRYYFRVYTIGLGLGLYGLSYRVDHTVYVDTDVATATMKPVLNYRIRLLLIVIDWCLLNGKWRCITVSSSSNSNQVWLRQYSTMTPLSTSRFVSWNYLMTESEERSREKIVQWKSGLEAKGLKVNEDKTKVMLGCRMKDKWFGPPIS